MNAWKGALFALLEIQVKNCYHTNFHSVLLKVNDAGQSVRCPLNSILRENITNMTNSKCAKHKQSS